MTDKLKSINREPIKYVAGRQKYSLLEKQIIALIINQLPKSESKDNPINPDTLVDMEISFPVKQLAETNWKRIDEATTNVMTRIVEYRDEDSGEFEKVTMFPYSRLKNGKITFKINRDIITELVKMKNGYSEYFLAEYLQLKSIYQVRLYEILSHYKNLDFKKYEIEDTELRDQLNVTAKSYRTQPALFERKVIKPVVEAINKYTSLKVSYVREKIKKGLYVTKFDVVQTSQHTILTNYPDWMKGETHLKKRSEFNKTRNPQKTEEAKKLCEKWGMYPQHIEEVVKYFECEIWMFNYKNRDKMNNFKNPAAVFCNWIGLKLLT